MQVPVKKDVYRNLYALGIWIPSGRWVKEKSVVHRSRYIGRKGSIRVRCSTGIGSAGGAPFVVDRTSLSILDILPICLGRSRIATLSASDAFGAHAHAASRLSLEARPDPGDQSATGPGAEGAAQNQISAREPTPPICPPLRLNPDRHPAYRPP